MYFYVFYVMPFWAINDNDIAITTAVTITQGGPEMYAPFVLLQ